MLEIKNVYKSYDKTEVLHDISFQVQENSIHALVGENNAGKTTLLKTLAGIYRADRGSILYDGEPVFDNPPVKQKIAYVADRGAFLRGYSVRRIIKLYQTMYP
ncbi:MAG: ATP-binding cassette domain-containing protein, partial [Lachnospiraceae bacterium]|nr:ATP-binding cassette domain-containing protein [Lachnospiraceae bacterium]